MLPRTHFVIDKTPYVRKATNGSQLKFPSLWFLRVTSSYLFFGLINQKDLAVRPNIFVKSLQLLVILKHLGMKCV